MTALRLAVGSQGVGKTSLIHRSTTGKFNHSLSSTMGAGFLTKKLTIADTKVHFQLWDTAGGERFRSLAKLYYRGALAAILVYDVTDESSLQDLKFWLQGAWRLTYSVDESDCPFSHT